MSLISYLKNKIMEKQTEILLSECLKEWNQEYLHYSPKEDKMLKQVFKTASKNGKSMGIPDRIYLDKNNKILIVFECKIDNLDEAKKDLELYKIHMNYENLNNYIILYCAFCGTDDKTKDYKFFDVKMENMNIQTFQIDEIYQRIGINHCNDLKPSSNVMELTKYSHTIHNHIRNKTKLSDEDKPLFISSILLAFKNKSFHDLIQNTSEYEKLKGETLSQIILNNLKIINSDKSFIDTFSFLESHLDNNTLFFFCKNIYDNIIAKNIESDVLNIFYSEFVKYQNKDSKSRGIVLTPEHIVKLMVSFLKINKEDIILDLCTGSGSFICESLKYSPSKVIGCEYQTKLYTLLMVNMILRENNRNKYELIRGDCFKNDFKATKSIINPPYSVKGESEWDFVLKQYESVSDTFTCIIPIGCITEHPENVKYKQKLLSSCGLKCVVKCNTKLFYPNASVETYILVFDKKRKEKTLFIDYSDDGILIKKHNGRVKNDEFETKLNDVINLFNNRESKTPHYYKKVNENDSWIYQNNDDVKILKKDLRNRRIEENNYRNKNIGNEDNDVVEFKKTKKFKLSSLFNTQKGKRVIDKCQNGDYPLISSSALNHGVYKCISEYDYNGKCITTANDGSIGSSFYHDGKIAITSHVTILSLKEEELIRINDVELVYMYFCELFKNIGKKYSFCRAWNLTRMRNEEIVLPVDENENVNYREIESMF